MTFQPAPYFHDIAADAPGATAYWIKAQDGPRLRIGHWPAQGETRGTVLIFPGRTEYIEKYAHVADDFSKNGYASVAVDWRGQGLGERLVPDTRVGHVNAFADYQHDVRAATDLAEALELPKPWFLLAHSMGGCIGLRALHEGLPVAASVFTGPMWGIRIASAVRPAAWAVGWTSKLIGLSHLYAPSTGAESYVATAAFEDNVLTRDRLMFDLMRDQVLKRPELQLGGPSLRWLHEALVETRQLAARPAPNVPCLTIVGDNERIVSVPRIEDRMASWPNGRLEVIKDGEHEVLMESDAVRAPILHQILEHFGTHAKAPSAALAEQV